MNRQVASIVIGVAALVIVLVAVLVLGSGSSDENALEDVVDVPAEVSETEPAEPWPVTLYFAGARGLLEVEGREIELVDGLQERASALVAALVEGPLNEEWFSPLPEGTTVLAADPGVDGALFVSLGQESSEVVPQMGSREEILMTYAVVNTLVENLDGVERVAILWGSSQGGTVAGHIEGTRPRVPSTRWVARPSSG